MTFKSVAVTGALLCFGLTVAIGAFSSVLVGTWGLASGVTSEIIARRTAMVFLGFGVALWMARNEPTSPARRGLALGFAVACFALATLGLAELAANHVGLGILMPVVVEVAMGAALVVSRDA